MVRVTPRIATLAGFSLIGGAALAEEVIEAHHDTEYHGVRIVQVATDLEHPWGLAFLPEGGMLVTERPGRINRVEDGRVERLSGGPDRIHARNQGGMLDITLHPDFTDNRWVYFTYARGDANETTVALARARLDDGAPRLTDLEEIFVADAAATPGRHYGSRIDFKPDGTLLMTVGDRGDDEHDPDTHRAQDTGDHVGTTLRLNDDGSVPGDNPFVADDQVRDEIYSYGHRNAQGQFIHPETGAIWQTEHGPRGGDELNRVQAGYNYGWPIISHGRDYATQEQIGIGRHAEGMESPIRDWTPAIAPSGLDHYSGQAFPRWEGDFLAGALVRPAIRRVVIEDETVVHEEEILRDTVGRVRAVEEGPGGHIYLLTDESDGGIYRLEPAD
ncbi:MULTISPECIES: PQQ-dependent sugar dehydrogenase [unclassified Halorhodospira]|uniref:PQQ-dependent sugar dehydrogenase n=1 Tax=unclassified Halorhodospira TaxID=2626748 RepID=UPI001EE8D6D3|nr:MULTISPECIES: PQQ-dependent sugar dehydrogenase [unclassified Halorhodospira]MCG5540077.1 PQQ-dependent sugar dehydrogenase [Halorhodospira sp. M39old]MCG5544885.1 PQQ-dependent sugar dehydrogenase [Halorhodospira sp. M38]